METEIKNYIDSEFDAKLGEVSKTLNNISSVLGEINADRIDTSVWTGALDSYAEAIKTELSSMSDEVLAQIGVKRQKRLVKNMRLYRMLAYQEIYVNIKTKAIVKYGDLYTRGLSLNDATAGCNRSATAFFTRVALPKEIEFENFYGGHSGFYAQPKKGQKYNNESTDNHLWVWGVNTNGCLGLGNNTNQPIPAQLKLRVRAKDIQTGKTYDGGVQTTLLLGEDGSIWGCGTNSKGELGIGNTVSSNVFVRSPHLQKIKKIALASYTYGSATCGQVLAINEDGELFAWGYNGFGALGLGNKTDPILTPQKVILSKKIKDMHTSCYEHSGWSQTSLILMEDGSVLSCGYNSQYQLGRNNTSNTETFQEVQDFSSSSPVPLTGVKKIYSGAIWGTCGALKENGDLLLWGQGEYGFGDRDTLHKGMTPKVVLSGVQDFILENEKLHTRCIAIMKDGSVMAFGKNDDRGLGLGLARDVYKFSKVFLPEGELQDIYLNVWLNEGGINAIVDERMYACGTSLDYNLNTTCGTLQNQEN